MAKRKTQALNKSQRKILAALNDPTGATYIGGFDILQVFELERAGLLSSAPDKMFSSFLAYKITSLGKLALGGDDGA